MFQQDNDLKHRAKPTKEWFVKKAMLEKICVEEWETMPKLKLTETHLRQHRVVIAAKEVLNTYQIRQYFSVFIFK